MTGDTRREEEQRMGKVNFDFSKASATSVTLFGVYSEIPLSRTLDFSNLQITETKSEQEPISRSIHFPCVRVTAFSQVGLFLDL